MKVLFFCRVRKGNPPSPPYQGGRREGGITNPAFSHDR